MSNTRPALRSPKEHALPPPPKKISRALLGGPCEGVGPYVGYASTTVCMLCRVNKHSVILHDLMTSLHIACLFVEKQAHLQCVHDAYARWQ